MVELPTELGAGSPFGRAEGGDQKQDYNDPAANLCAGTKPRFQFGAHRNTPSPSQDTGVGKVAKILRGDIAIADEAKFWGATPSIPGRCAKANRPAADSITRPGVRGE